MTLLYSYSLSFTFLVFLWCCWTILKQTIENQINFHCLVNLQHLSNAELQQKSR